MKIAEITKYLKSMSISLIMMLLFAYGFATGNPWLQPLYIMIFYIVLSMGYQFFQFYRTRDIVIENAKEAARMKRGTPLFRVNELETTRARGGVEEESQIGSKMLVMMIMPMAVFFGAGYIMNIIFPGIPYWQTYVIAFLLTMPISIILNAKVGLAQGMSIATPSTYMVSERGIIFDQTNQSFILRFPLTRMETQRVKNYIEVEGKTEVQFIPYKLKLFTEKVDQLEKVLSRHLVDQFTSKEMVS